MVQIVVYIQVIKDVKLVYWGLIFKDNVLMLLVVLELLKGDQLKLEGYVLKVVDLKGLSLDCMVLWILLLKMVVGGVLVEFGLYVWIVDIQIQVLCQVWVVMFDWIEVL